MNNIRRARSQGFTLIEVLVALLVLSISLLGIANLQLTGLRLAQDGIYRTQAALLAFDMSQRMLANKLASQPASLGTDLYLGNTATTFVVDCSLVDCTAAQMADYDTALWQAMIADRIASSVNGDVTFQATYTTTVWWWDRAGEEQLDEQVTGIAVETYTP